MLSFTVPDIVNSLGTELVGSGVTYLVRKEEKKAQRIRHTNKK